MLYEGTTRDPRIVSCPNCGASVVLPATGDKTCVCGQKITSAGSLNEHVSQSEVKQLLRG